MTLSKESILLPGLAALALFTSVAACGDGNVPVAGRRCSTSADCAPDQACVDSLCVARADGGGRTDAGPSPTALISARLEPASAVLESVDGAMPTQALALIAMQRDGTEVTITGVRWTATLPLVGTLDAEGLFTATGNVGGVVTVMALSPTGLAATATVTVNLRRTVYGPGADATAATHFSGVPTADPSAIDVLYPLEGAVMPANVFPPTIQWAPVGVAGDLFRVHIVEPFVDLSAILVHSGADFGSGWAVPRDVWRPLADSSSGAPIAITVERFDAATSTLIAGAGARTMRLARGNVFGAVYYENRDGSANLLRIATETATLTDLIPNPYPDSSGTRCVGCHALTHDGRYAFATNAQTQTVYDLTVDLTGDPPASRYPFAGGPAVASFDSMGTYFVGGSHVSSSLTIYDAVTGAVAPSTGLPASGAGYPAWSPDGMHIAYPGDIVTAPPGHPEPGDPIGGNLYIADRTGAGLDFTPRVLHTGAALAGNPEGGENDTHPAWTPDSRWIAFQHGPGTFTHVVRNAGALYLIGLDGTLHRLDHASGGTTPTDGFWPTFAPYVTAESGDRRYYWMAFYTRRNYGNEVLGTRGAQRRQLWVAAIDTEPTPGTDPSFVPYWLPGQGVTTSNFSAFWAPEACRATGADCSTASECCSGRCESGATGAFTCTPPPPVECHRSGEGCGADGDCCEGFLCIGNVCNETLR